MSGKMDMYGINKSKAYADWEKYASLFSKHIQQLENGNVCFVSLGNIDVIFKLLENFKKCKVYIYDNESICESVKFLASMNGFNEEQFIFNSSDDILESIKESDMKFDRIVMNPPYSKNLHLKILAEAVKHLKDDDSTCVNLSPIGKLQTAWRREKITKELAFLDSTTATIDLIECDDAVAMFNLGNCGTDLGVWKCYAKGHSNVFELGKSLTSYSDFIEHIKKTIADMPKMNGRMVDANAAASHTMFIKFVDGLSLKNHGGHGISSYAAVSINFATATKFTSGSHCKYVLLNNEVERLNFWKIYTSDVIRFMYMTLMGAGTEYELLPWLGDAVNPRTGLKGYQGEWTDEDLCTFFNITDDEKKVIEETMAKYK